MLEIRRSNDRGHAQHGWLESRHTFSFADYHDADFMGLGVLRVINEDHVQPGKGFSPHRHRDMEIISYSVQGLLAHRDSTGSEGVIRPGEVQVMSAGRGIQHSEMNASTDDSVRFLQIWVLPAEHGTAPAYRQQDFGSRAGLILLVSPDGREGSLRIGQDIDLHRALLANGETSRLELRRDRGWVQVVRGQLEVNGQVLHAGDGAAVSQVRALELSARGDVEGLIFDLH